MLYCFVAGATRRSSSKKLKMNTTLSCVSSALCSIGFTANRWSIGSRSNGRAAPPLTSLFYGRIKERGGQAGQHTADVLGLVMAHEIGHLLGFAHTPTGIMRAHWVQADWVLAAQGPLLFSRAQGEQLRARITRAD